MEYIELIWFKNMFEEFTVRIPSPIGYLDGKLVVGDKKKKIGVVFCCPHPIYSDNMDSPIIKTIFNYFADQDYSVLRFDYRGKGASSGHYGKGLGERMDVRNAINFFLNHEETPKNILLIGYSFGAAIGTSIADEFPEICGYVAISYPYPISFTFISHANIPIPKLFVYGDLDKVISISALKVEYEKLLEPKYIKEFEGVTHSWKTMETELATYIYLWVQKNILN